MPLLTTYTESVRVKYVSTFLSKATIFNVFIGILCLVIPYLICYRMQGNVLNISSFHNGRVTLFKLKPNNRHRFLANFGNIPRATRSFV